MNAGRLLSVICALLFSLAAGCAPSQITPPSQWGGATRPSVTDPAHTKPAEDPATLPIFPVGRTRLPADRVVTAARSVFEPIYGPMEEHRSTLRDGSTQHLLLTPRFEVANLGLDYCWFKVDVVTTKKTGETSVRVTQVYRNWRPIRFSAHGGLLPFPTWIDGESQDESADAMLAKVMRTLNDPHAQVTGNVYTPK